VKPMPLYRVVLQRTAECFLELSAMDARDVTTKDFRLEYGLPEPARPVVDSDPEPMTWHLRDQTHGGGALVVADTGWTVVLVSREVGDTTPSAQQTGP
jgi:hypothetical protein